MYWHLTCYSSVYLSFIYSFTVYPAFSRVGSGNIVLSDWVLSSVTQLHVLFVRKARTLYIIRNIYFLQIRIEHKSGAPLRRFKFADSIIKIYVIEFYKHYLLLFVVLCSVEWWCRCGTLSHFLTINGTIVGSSWTLSSLSSTI